MIQKLLLLLVSAMIANAAVVPHIVNGTDAKAHSKPWLLTVEKMPDMPSSKKVSDCGASLLRISHDKNCSDIALTAAHCIGFNIFPHEKRQQKCYNKTSLFQLHAVIASNHAFREDDKNEISLKVIDGQCHEGWDPKNGSTVDDIAILKLEKPLCFNDTIQPIDLPKPGDSAVQPGTICNVAGWGGVGFEGLNEDEIKGAKVLQELDVEIQSDDECKKQDPVDFIAQKMICEKASDRNGHICVGDSGGPLVCPGTNGQPTQYGIASFGNKPCVDSPTAGIYTNVAHYLDWIQQEVNRLSEM